MRKSMAATPSSLGFSMPAEWEPHEATWLCWPKNEETFPPAIIRRVEDAYCKMIGALQQGEKVKLLVDSKEEEQRVEKILQSKGVMGGTVLFFMIKSVDVWMRDYGPTFLSDRKTNKRSAVRWKFNAWGNKYDDLLLDNSTGDAIADSFKGSMEVFRPGIVMEGGSIDVNGQGSLITTEQCLLNKNRNPALSKLKIEQYLCDYLGANRIVWLKDGIDGDDTDGHVDDFARFVGKNSVLCAREDDEHESNHAVLKRNEALLSESGFEAIPLPMPTPAIDPAENRRLPASFANFYIANSCVLLPTFNDRNDAKAIEIVQGCFPNREVVPIPCRDLVYGYGGIHCVTQQEPK